MGRHVALKVLPTHARLNPHDLERFKREARAAARLHHTNIVPVFGVGEHDSVHFYAMQFIQGQGLDQVILEVKRMRSRSVSRRGLSGPASSGESPKEIPFSGNLVEALVTGVWKNPLTADLSAPDDIARTNPPAPGLAPSDQRPLRYSTDAVEVANAESIDAGKVAQKLINSRDKPRGVSTHGRTPSASATVSDSTDRLGQSSRYYDSVARIGIQVAEALAYAHAQGVLHRDIKPSNLLLDAHGTVWVTDFGLAKADDSNVVTHTGDVVGTLRYMAPERFRGDSDRRSDVYALGVTLYELLTLRPPFEESDRLKLVQQVSHQKPARPRQLDPRIPRDLETIVLKAMDKDVVRRYQSATELAEDLRRLVSDLPIQARRVSLPERSWRWCRRNSLVASLIAAVAALLIVVAVGSSMTSLRLRSLLSRAEQAEGIANDRLQQVQRAETERTRQLEDSLLHHARAERWSGHVGQRFESLKALSRAVPLAKELGLGPQRFLELRNEAIACLALPDVRLTRDWEGFPDGTRSSIVCDAKMEHYARTDLQGNISVRRMSDDQEVARLPGPGDNTIAMKFSPDWSRLLALHGRSFADRPTNLALWDWRRGKIVFYAPVRVAEFALDFSPDGKRLAFAPETQRQVFIQKPENEVEDLKFDAAFAPFRVAFNPAGDQIAVAGNGLQIHNAVTGQLLCRIKVPRNVHYVAWDSAGQRLATSCGNDIQVWDTQTGQPRGELRGHQARVTFVSFNQAGDIPQSSSWDDTSRLWNVAAERQMLRMATASGCGNSDWETLGLIGRNGTSLRHWEVSLGRELRDWHAGKSLKPAHSVSLSRDGDWLARATDDGVELWDVRREQQQAVVNLGRTLGVVFHPSSKSFFTGGSSGLQQWPLERNESEMRIGPPETLPVLGPFQRLDIDATGRLLAVVGGGEGQFWNLENAAMHVAAVPHALAVFVKLSPDGRWGVTGPWNGRGVKVWDMRSGALVRDLIPEADIAMMAFSPDGRTLVTGEFHRYRVWDVGTWQLVREFSKTSASAPFLTFSSAARLLAMLDGHSIELRETSHWDKLARFQAPSDDNIGWFQFVSDGGRLVVGMGTPQRICQWDLRLIRQRLAEIGLDWNDSPYPPEKPRTEVQPLTVRVELGSPKPPSRGAATMSAQDRQRLAILNQNVDANPTSAKAYYDRGSFYDRAGQWDQGTADAARALELFDRDIAADPNKTTAYRLRGYVHRRFGNFDQAVLDHTQWLNANPDDRSVLQSRGRSYVCLRDGRSALRDFEHDAELNPGSATAWSYVAWVQVAGPPDVRDPQRALSAARKAVALDQKAATHQKNLGITLYRLGKYDEAMQAFQEAAKLRATGHEASDLFFLAMIHHHRGQKDSAQQFFDDALRWWREHTELRHPDWYAELEAFRSEAAAFLGIDADPAAQLNVAPFSLNGARLNEPR